MLYYESFWIRGQIERLKSMGVFGHVLNIGSSTDDFVNEFQPYIKKNVTDELSLLGQVTNVDIKSGPGVDVVSNFLLDEDRVNLKALNPKVIVVSNLLEHLPDPLLGVSALSDLADKGSFLILTGPKSYPFHPDPIDNMFRPSKRDLKDLFGKEWKLIEITYIRNGTVLTGNYAYEHWKVPIRWAIRQFNLKTARTDPKNLLRILINLLYPVSAFCLVLERI